MFRRADQVSDRTEHRPPAAPVRSSPALFVALTFVLSIPLWLLGSRPLPLPVHLPASAISALVPMFAGALLSFRQGRSRELLAYTAQAWDGGQAPRRARYLLAIALPPAIYLASYGVMRATRQPLPATTQIRWATAPGLAALFLLTGTGEELGWSGYATGPLLGRWEPRRASLLLGAPWALWHAVTFVQTGYAPSFILWQSLKTLAMRVVLVWLYRRGGGSVLSATLYHASDNVCWALFPNASSHYSPMVTGTLTWLLALAILLGQKASGGTRRRRGAGAPSDPSPASGREISPPPPPG